MVDKGLIQRKLTLLEQKKKENDTKAYVARAFASVGATAADTKSRPLNLNL